MIRTIRPESARYLIESFLGEGSMAFVYKATRVDSRGFSRQTVALKVLKSENQVRDLVTEMETLSRVRSPHCVSLFGWENLPEGPAIVMEWIEGVSLEELYKTSRLEDGLIDEIMSQVQSGLRDLQAADLCHGDLSPSNILIDVEGRVRLVDFGLHRRPGSRTIAGTARFMAPEYWAGGVSTVAGDLFSLGLISLDLKNGTLNTVGAAEGWRRRAEQVSVDEESWFSRDPKKRTWQTLASEGRRRRMLGRLVLRSLSNRAALARTLRFEVHPARLGVLRLVVALALALLFPIAPFGESDRFQPIPSAQLEIRTQKWMKIRLGVVDLGYTPISKGSLPAGLHRILWKSARGEGSKVISIGFGERKVLTDRDF